MVQHPVDASIDDAWRVFRVDLGDQLSELPVGDCICASVPDSECALMQFTVTRAHRVRCTVRPGEDARRTGWSEALGSAGWRALRNGSLIYEVPRRRVDELSGAAVSALRDNLHVLHPSFLVTGTPVPHEPQLVVATVPDSPGQLRALIVDTLEAMIKRPVEVDDDGDIPLPTGEVSSWLQVLPRSPAIRFVGTIVAEVDDTQAAARFLAEHALRWPGIALALRGREVVAVSVVDFSAFTPNTLTAAVGQWLEFIFESVPEIVGDLAATSSVSTDDAAPGGTLPEALQTILELDSGAGTLRAHEIARICDFDRSAILTYIHACEEQFLSWRTSAVDAEARGDSDEAASCRHESAAWQATTHKLRAALRVVVLADDARDRGPDSRFRPGG